MFIFRTNLQLQSKHMCFAASTRHYKNGGDELGGCQILQTNLSHFTVGVADGPPAHGYIGIIKSSGKWQVTKVKTMFYIDTSDILLREIIFILLLFQFGRPRFQFYFSYSS